MRIGYPCINRTIGCRGNRTFQLRSYSEGKLAETVAENLACLREILRFNAGSDILFFRVTSDLVPFASHPICRFDWQNQFRTEFEGLGRFIRSRGMRVSMHPDQFTLLNSLDRAIFERSHRELEYHAQVLDLMGLDASAKIQIHVGGVYGDRNASIARFIERFAGLDAALRRRLVIENDDRQYTLAHCLHISGETGIPVVFDTLHHEINNSGEELARAFPAFTKTWSEADGLPMVDYSSQEPQGRKGRHAETIDRDHFRAFIASTRAFDFDLMLEIKDKETSAIAAVDMLRGNQRFAGAGDRRAGDGEAGGRDDPGPRRAAPTRGQGTFSFPGAKGRR